MIVCHCNVLTKAVITDAIEALVAEDPYRLITPGLVYRQLGKRGKCCGCFPQVVGLIVKRLEEFQTGHPGLVVTKRPLRPGAPGGLVPVGQDGLQAVALAPVHQRRDD